MSLPTSGLGSPRKLRAPSIGSRSSPRLIPGTFDAGDGGSDAAPNYGSFRGRRDSQASQAGLNALTASYQREPTRSSVHLSYHGMPHCKSPKADRHCASTDTVIAHADNTTIARSVREDTAELASYALSDRASARSVSPPRQGSIQMSLESYFGNGAEDERSPLRTSEGLLPHMIEEVSEPVTPEKGSLPTSDRGPGSSVLTKMLKNSPPETPTGNEDGHERREVAADGDVDVDSLRQGSLITSDGVERDPTEHTSLLGNKDTRFESQHQDWIHGEQDVERQGSSRRPAWPNLRNVVTWPQEKVVKVARTILSPKAWDSKAIWTHAVVEPAGALPAVILGTLLNILDALSYGKFRALVLFLLLWCEHSLEIVKTLISLQA